MQSTGATLALAILVIAAAFALSSVNCLVEDIPTDYLALPEENDIYRNEMYDEMLSKDTRPAGLAPEKMLEDFAERSKSAPSAYERAFAKQMHEVGVKGLNACNTLTHRFVYEILSLAKQYPNSPALANYVNFLRTIGRAKYAECAAGVPLLFGQRTTHSQHGMLNLDRFLMYENAMDLLFSAYANSKEKKLDNHQLYKVAKLANLAHGGNFDVSRMLKIASPILSSKFMATKPSKSEILQRFWDNACDIIHRPFQVEFGNYNIAVALGSQSPGNIPARFLKINEYNHICMTSGDAVGENLQRQAELASSSRSKWYKLGKN